MEDKRTSAVWIVVAMLLVIVLPVLYVLSAGPMVACFGEPDWLLALYAPLIWLVNGSDFAKAWILWYVDLWIPDSSNP